MSTPNIQIPVDLTNPGQFFACCGLLELADRVDESAEGWFDGGYFNIRGANSLTLRSVLDKVAHSEVVNTMTAEQLARLKELSAMGKKKREADNVEDEKNALESLRRELPIILKGDFSFRIDWFCDEFSGGSRFKTWAGMQSVLEVTRAMHAGFVELKLTEPDKLWDAHRGSGLPFNFDSNLGGQGSALDIGFSFDPLAGSDTTRIVGSSKPALELLCFIGLQRFRPFEFQGENRFAYAAWDTAVPVAIAPALACLAVQISHCPCYDFRLLYRTKYLKSFLPAQPIQGERDE